MNSSAVFHDVLRDLSYGVRVLRRNPGFAAVATLSLAIGIGLNTTMFSIVNAVLLRDTRVTDPSSLVEVYSSASKEFPQMTTSYPDFLDLRANVKALTGLAAHSMARGILTHAGRSELSMGEVVTENYFDLLGVPLAQGRGFLPEENVTEATHPVIVLSHGLWQRRFGGRNDVLGKTLKLSDLDYTIIGIAPPDFSGMLPGLKPDFWAPIMMVDRLSFSGVQSRTGEVEDSRVKNRGSRWLFVKGRLAPEATVEQAQAQAATLFARLQKEYPDKNKDVLPTLMAASSIRFHPLLDKYIKAASAVLLIAVGLVLAIACANVANMLLARAASRRREFAIRAAIGASRGRVVRQLLSESFVLALLGGVLGTLVAYGAGGLLTGLQGGGSLPIPVEFAVSVDGSVLAYAALASIITAMLFGLAPAWTASKTDLVPALKADATGESTVRRRITLRDALVVGQLAISLVLLVSGALLTRGLLAAQSTDLGYDPDPVAAVSFNLQMNGYDVDRAVAFRKRLLSELRATPGVERAALAGRLPLSPDINLDGVRIRGHHEPEDDPTPIDGVSVGADYFEAVGVPIVEGRAFTESDIEGARRVLVVNQTMARKFWPNQSAIGQWVYRSEFKDEPYEIVGVSRDHKVRSVGEEPRPYMHSPYEPGRTVGLAVRTRTSAAAALPMLRSAILALDPEIVFTEDAPAREVAATTVAPTRIGAALLGAFGVLALSLAAVGLYGVISYSVSQRTREVGVRMALGARPENILRLVLGQGLRLAGTGVVVGLLAAAAVASVLESMLYGVSTFDPGAYAVAVGILLIVSLAANLVPALRATRVHPMVALRID